MIKCVLKFDNCPYRPIDYFRDEVRKVESDKTISEEYIEETKSLYRKLSEDNSLYLAQSGFCKEIHFMSPSIPPVGTKVRIRKFLTYFFQLTDEESDGLIGFLPDYIVEDVIIGGAETGGAEIILQLNELTKI